jgi:hypothetical protein
MVAVWIDTVDLERRWLVIYRLRNSWQELTSFAEAVHHILLFELVGIIISGA